MEKKSGYMIVDMVNKRGWVAKDATQAAELVGVSRNRFYHWFAKGKLGYTHKYVMILKGYELVKSSRGGKTTENLIPKSKKKEG